MIWYWILGVMVIYITGAGVMAAVIDCLDSSYGTKTGPETFGWLMVFWPITLPFIIGYGICYGIWHLCSWLLWVFTPIPQSTEEDYSQHKMEKQLPPN